MLYKRYTHLKKIAFITRSLGVGGIEKSLIGLINSLSEDKFDITVLITTDDRRLQSDIKRKISVQLLPRNFYTGAGAIKNKLKRLQIKSAFRLLWLKLTEKAKNGGRNREIMDAHMIFVPDEKFDVAIAYYLPDTYEIPYVLDCIQAKKRAAWMHMDIKQYAPRMPYLKSYYKRFDRVFCVSDFVKEGYGVIYPKQKKKARVFHNIIDESEIITQAEAYPVEKKEVTLFSCARISNEKQPLLCAEALKKLVDDGINAYWYWAGGDTNGYINEVTAKIKELNLENRFILLSALTNPYPYYKACDVYVQASWHESYCISIAEAKILCGRIVSTDIPVVHESLTPSPSCKIVRSDKTELADGIKSVLSAPKEHFPSADFSKELKNFVSYLLL